MEKSPIARDQALPLFATRASFIFQRSQKNCVNTLDKPSVEWNTFYPGIPVFLVAGDYPANAATSEIPTNRYPRLVLLPPGIGLENLTAIPSRAPPRGARAPGEPKRGREPGEKEKENEMKRTNP